MKKIILDYLIVKGGFIVIHLGCFLTFFVGVSWTALIATAITYILLVFSVTAGYHRYFAHRSYKTSRFFQFVLAYLGTTAAQGGPLWWSATHRHHHRHADTEEDLHSPIIETIWWAHAGWILGSRYSEVTYERVKDLSKYPELRFLNDYLFIPPTVLTAFYLLTGIGLNYYFPHLNTSGLQLAVWGYCVGTTLTYHATFLINSLTHVVGQRRFDTRDHSQNSFIIALITFGEGWHNNHHRFPSSERQGFYWWEIDITHYLLTLLSWLGLVWDLRQPPDRIYEDSTDFFKKPSQDVLIKAR